jgi:hypothetical protein
MILSAQTQSPIPKISQQMASFFNSYPREKVLLLTDKTMYRPGETIWFRARVGSLANEVRATTSNEIWVKLFDEKGAISTKELFKLTGAGISGDVTIPQNLPKGNYTLVAHTSTYVSPEEVSCTNIKIDPEYTNQMIAEISIKDSISTAGKPNEIEVTISDLSGDIHKNSSFRYQFALGSEVTVKGKIKTDENGKAKIPFILPVSAGSEPFVFSISDLKDDLINERFIPSEVDLLKIRFFPEGGHLISGIPSKVGFTVSNQIGMPVDFEGLILDAEGRKVGMAKTLRPGIGLFTLENIAKQKYKLVITGKGGREQTFELPAASADGVSLAVVKTDADYISTNLICADKQKHTLSLVVTQGESVGWAADMEINGVGRIKIPVKDLPAGVNLLSVFSDDARLLAQRIVFADKKEVLNLEVTPEKNTCKPDENLKVKIRMTDKNNQVVAGVLCISVTDQQRNLNAKPHIDDFYQIFSDLETPFDLISGVLDVFLGV